jgi:hypothetical protein
MGIAGVEPRQHPTLMVTGAHAYSWQHFFNIFILVILLEIRHPIPS